jgi:hypothetical protein
MKEPTNLDYMRKDWEREMYKRCDAEDKERYKIRRKEMKVSIKVSGCDDETEILMEMTEEQFAFIQEVANKVTEESTYHCQPTMSVFKIEEEK